MRPKFSIFISKPSIKEKIKKFIFKKNLDGPKSLIENLKIGLKKNNINFSINPKKIQKNQICWVINDRNKLKELINLKKKIKFNLIAGPNISILPTDYDNLLIDDNINCVIVPSLWVKKLYLEASRNKLKNKILIWPIGVDETYWKIKKTKKNVDFLIYNKNNFKIRMINKITTFFRNKNISFKIIKYGSYFKAEYLNLLSKSKYLIFFSKSESQGIACFESWSADVPIIAYRYEKKYLAKFKQKSEVCPYLSRSNGYYFNNLRDFRKIIFELNKNKKIFTPRKWLLKKFNLKINIKNLFLNVKKFC